MLGSLLLAGAPARAADTRFVTHAGTLSAPAVAVATGADGAVWHVTADGRVGRTTIFGVSTEWPLGAGDAEPVDIAAGWDGTMWVVDRAGTVWGVSPLGVTVPVATLDGGAPTAIAIGWDGMPWVALPNADGRKDAIVRVTPAGGVTEHPTQSRRDPSDLAPGFDGALWFTEPGNPGRVARIDLAGDVREFTDGLSRNRAPSAIVAGGDGALWFTEGRGGGGFGRIDASATITEYPGAAPEAIAAGRDGAIYFTQKSAIGRITATGGTTIFSTGRARPVALAATADGAIWFADATTASLGRLAAPPTAPVQLGVTVQVTPKRGVVRVRPRGSRRFVTLETTVTVPVGSTIDARRGRVRLVSAVGAAGELQAGRFSGGRFRVRQRPGGLTQLVLRGRLECGRRTASPSVATTARRRHRRRRLWGTDLGGAFSTLGRDSVTTVRGTKWLTEDRCRGTLTRVERGSVVVRDRHTGERVVLHAGERHFARHRP